MTEPSAIVRAAVCREFGAPLSVENVALPKPSSRQVRVKLSACAICHSDIIYMDGDWGGEVPAVFGHEAAGVVVEPGADSGYEPGAHVLVTLMRSCGACSCCERGVPSQCVGDFNTPVLRDEAGAAVSVGLKTAAFAEQVVVDCSQLAPLPASLPFAEASLLSCGVITGWGAVVNTAQVSAGASVAVVGCGGVGINCLQAAKQCGAEPLLAVDVAESKLDMSKTFGATHALNPTSESFMRDANDITGGRGFDFVFMAAGSGRAVEQSLPLVSRIGALVLVGMPRDGDLSSLSATTIANYHQRILGSKMGGARLREDIPRLIHLHERGRLKLTELIAGRFTLDEINEAVEQSRGGGALRNVILFD